MELLRTQVTRLQEKASRFSGVWCLKSVDGVELLTVRARADYGQQLTDEFISTVETFLSNLKYVIANGKPLTDQNIKEYSNVFHKIRYEVPVSVISLLVGILNPAETFKTLIAVAESGVWLRETQWTKFVSNPDWHSMPVEWWLPLLSSM